MTLKNACAYIRVSTDKQEELSPDAQKRLIIDYCKKNGYTITNENIFIENGISGKKADKRPEFKRMIALAKSKEHPFDVILVWKFSRFARNQEESIVYKSMLKKANVDVVSVSEPVIDGPFGSLIERIIEWMDEYYSIRLSGEVIRGMTEKALRGGYNAQPPLGYRKNSDTGIPEIYEPEAVIVRNIFSNISQGLSLIDTARSINNMGFHTRRGGMFEQRTIRYIIENPFYYGYVRWNRQNPSEHTIKDKSEWIIAPGAHPVLINKESWDFANEQLIKISRPYKERGTSGIKHWLSGIVKCSSCGSSLVSNSLWKGHSTSFQCSGYNKCKCKVSHYIKTERLEAGIYEGFLKVLSSKNVTYEKVSEHSYEEKIDTAALLKNIEDKERRIKQAYRDGIDTLEEYKDNKAILQKEREKVMEIISKQQPAVQDEDNETMLRQIKNAYEIIKNEDLDKLTRANAIRSVVSKAVYDNEKDTLDIYFRLIEKSL
jgi:DNA invertase Pin-like site-specific DNA recombinase